MTFQDLWGIVLFMIVQNPLVPPATAQGSVAPVANAPRAADHETPTPVPASDRGEAPPPEDHGQDRGQDRGRRVDITV